MLPVTLMLLAFTMTSLMVDGNDLSISTQKADKQWNDFKRQFRKKYASKKEESQR